MPEEGSEEKGLIDAVNGAGETLRVTWVTLLSLVTYLFVAVGSTTHKDLLLEKAQPMPILDIELPLRTFYWWAPVLLIAVHAYYLVQFFLVSLRLAELAQFIKHGGDSQKQWTNEEVEKRRKIAETGLDSGLIVQYVAGRGAKFEGPRKMIALAIISTSVVAPLLLLLAFEITFLPYHSQPMTNWHRLAFQLDLGLVFYMWPKASTVGIIGSVPFPDVPAPGRAYTKTVGELGRDPKSYDRAIAALAEISSYVRWLLATIGWLTLLVTRSWRRLVIAALAIAAGYFSVAVANFPDELAERAGSSPCPALYGWWYGVNDAREVPGQSDACLAAIFFDGPIDYGAGVVRSPFARNLILPDLDFIDASDDEVNKKVAERQFQYNFTGRNLSHAVIIAGDMRGVRLDGANLSHAHLAGTKFKYSSLSCVDRNGNGGGRIDSGECANLDSVVLGPAGVEQTDFTGANLVNASLREAELASAVFTEADLASADFSFSGGSPVFSRAEASATTFNYVVFDSVDFREARVSNARFYGSTMQNIDGRGARFDLIFAVAAQFRGDFLGADFSYASAYGATFAGNFDGANFYGANVDGSSFTDAKLAAVELGCTNLQGVQSGTNNDALSFDTSIVWRSDIPDSKSQNFSKFEQGMRSGQWIEGNKIGSSAEAISFPCKIEAFTPTMFSYLLNQRKRTGDGYLPSTSSQYRANKLNAQLAMASARIARLNPESTEVPGWSDADRSIGG